MSRDEITQEVQRRIDGAVDAGFSGAVSVTWRGQRLVASGHGFADRERRTPNTLETAFDVGSIVKLYTAIAIFQLEERGMLRLSDPLSELLPNVPADKASITLREILLHRAGFDDYHDTKGDFEAMTREEARARILAQRLLFVPGSAERYSNSGYTLLADIVQETTGRAFTEYIRRFIFEPAGMAHTGFYSEPVWERVSTAIGYEAERNGDNDPARWPYTWALVGNGGLVTTVVDLDRFSEALWSARLFSDDTLDRLQREYLSSEAVRVAGHVVYGSAGAGDYGLGGVLLEAPEQQTRVVIATNTYETFDIESFAADLTAWLVMRPAPAE